MVAIVENMSIVTSITHLEKGEQGTVVCCGVAPYLRHVSFLVKEQAGPLGLELVINGRTMSMRHADEATPDCFIAFGAPEGCPGGAIFSWQASALSLVVKGLSGGDSYDSSAGPGKMGKCARCGGGQGNGVWARHGEPFDLPCGLQPANHRSLLTPDSALVVSLGAASRQHKRAALQKLQGPAVSASFALLALPLVTVQSPIFPQMGESLSDC
ncbi:hypothetical protein B0T22DRAFT_210028 [Podospora appendiculata]|uniref:Uncharacterized protein n=1 Tax=Podospora appendiculata TaxID=314037 RepID=A0AAE1CA23_9PEZI|nr:hypothetical protein B0T22DRAFT_210028 [Podospora appendiculata]